MKKKSNEKFNYGINQRVVISNSFDKYRIFLARIEGSEFMINNYLDIIHLFKGKMKIKINRDILMVEEGDVVLISPGLPYQVIEEEKNSQIVMQIESKFISNILDIEKDSFYKLKDRTCKERLAHYLASLYDMYFKDEWEGEESDRLVKEMCKFLEKSCLRKQIRHMSSKDGIEQAIYKIAKYIYKNHIKITEEEISLYDIADKYDINYYYLSRNFKDTIGMSYTELLLKLRTNKALDLILNTDKRMAQICKESGFLNMKSMNMCFQDIFNLPPSQVRKLYLDVHSKIKQSDLYQEDETQNFLRLKDKELTHTTNFIKDSLSLKIDAESDLGNSNAHIMPTIDINNVMDLSYGLDNLNYLLEKMDLRKILLNFEIEDDKIYLLDRSSSRYELNLFQLNQLVNTLRRGEKEVSFVLNYEIPKTKKAYREKFNLDFEKQISSKLNIISSAIGLESLKKYRFILRIKNIKDKLENDKLNWILSNIGFYISILDKKLGKKAYKWGLALEEVRSFEDLELYKKLQDVIYPDCYILAFDYQSYVCPIIDSMNHYLDLTKSFKLTLKNNQTFVIDARYDLSKLDIDDNYKWDYAYLYTLKLFLKMRREGFKIASIQFLNKGEYIDTFIYTNLGIKTNYYYISRFNMDLGSKVLDVSKNYYITREGEDLIILLFDDHNEYYNYAKKNGFVSYDKIVNYTLRIEGIKGLYKMVQLDVNHYNNNLVYKKIEGRYWNYLSGEEGKYLESTYMPRIDIDFIDVYPDYIFHFSRKVLKYKMIRLIKI